MLEKCLLLFFPAAAYAHGRLAACSEALYYEEKRRAGDIEENKGEHKLWTKDRIVSFTTMSIALTYTAGWVSGLLSLLSMAAIFHFTHDYYFYQETNKYVPGFYPNGWRNQSPNRNKDTAAWFDHSRLSTPYTRLAMLILGSLLYIALSINSIINFLPWQ